MMWRQNFSVFFVIMWCDVWAAREVVIVVVIFFFFIFYLVDFTSLLFWFSSLKFNDGKTSTNYENAPSTVYVFSFIIPHFVMLYT